SGLLFSDHRLGWGVDHPDLLVWVAPTVLMNPTITSERLERERRLDPVRFAREYEAAFAEDISVFLPGAWVDAAIATGVYERGPQPGWRCVAAVDASGGGADAFTLAICHGEGSGAERRVVQDVCKGWGKPRDGKTDLEGIVQQIASIVKSYGIASVCG